LLSSHAALNPSLVGLSLTLNSSSRIKISVLKTTTLGNFLCKFVDDNSTYLAATQHLDLSLSLPEHCTYLSDCNFVTCVLYKHSY